MHTEPASIDLGRTFSFWSAPGNGGFSEDERLQALISTAGARPNPRWLAPLIAQGDLVYCGFDADPTGENMARAMIALHPTVQRLRPPHHDWNDVLKART